MKKTIWIIAAAAMLVLILSACGLCRREEYPLDRAELESVAKEWFLQKYGMKAEVENVSRKQVGEKTLLPEITVYYDKNRFELVLNEDFSPIADNVNALQTIQAFEKQSISELIGSTGHLSDLGIEFYCPFYWTEQRYRSQCAVHINDLPEENETDFWWNILQELKRQSIDDLVIIIEAPEFLCLYGGFQLEAEYFPTTLEKESFDRRFLNLLSRVYWDESKFEEKLSELRNAGFVDCRFYIRGYSDGRTLDIVLQYKLTEDDKVAEKKARNLAADMDESCFFKKGTKTRIIPKRVPTDE